MADAPGDNGNGKVTLAILATKLDAINDKLDCMADHEKRISVLESRQETHADEIKALRQRDTYVGALSAALSALAAFLGVRQ